VRRILERKKNTRCNSSSDRPSVNLERMHYTGFVPVNIGSCKQYKHLVFGSVVISLETGNNCVCLGDDIVLVSNIIYWNDEVHFVYQRFCYVSDFYDYPLKSGLLGTYRVGKLNKDYQLASITTFKWKCVILPAEEDFIVLLVVTLCECCNCTTDLCYCRENLLHLCNLGSLKQL
jgi:hypothetical protein